LIAKEALPTDLNPAHGYLEPFTPIKPEQLPANVFRANDIRGLTLNEITPQFARQLGRAFSLVVKEQGQNQVCICRDGRLSSEELSSALQTGLVESGIEVVNLGVGPTPLLSQYVATQTHSGAGIMVTASHNAKEYNGFKMILGGTSFSGEKIAHFKERMAAADFEAAEGRSLSIDATPQYLDALLEDIGSLTGTGLVIDGANGAAGPLAIRVFGNLCCEIEELYCDIDGNFPNHGPDPCQSSNLTDLCRTVTATGSDFGIALDGDGDRVVAVDELGRIVTPDQLYQLFSQDLLSRTPAASFVFDVKASRQVVNTIKKFGGNPIMEKSGRTFIQDRVKATGALLGGEYSSHYFFNDRWNAVDDGIYAACRLAEIIQQLGRSLSEILKDFPSLPATEELEIEVQEEQKTEIFQKFRQNAVFAGAELVEIDGLRIEYPDAWGLVRVSNTGPKLSIRFEGETEQALIEMQAKVRYAFEQLCPELKLPF
jgi:phosphomannomutase / phosphoglucomutase